MKIKNIFGHLKTIHTHRKWVRRYCFWAGIPWRGLTHDLSKYSPTEFWESLKYYNGVSSPINEAKRKQGISYAWMHHKGRNSHHYEYWMDNFDDGGIARVMPKKDFVELVCDYLGAARAYSKQKFSYQNELNWWLVKREHCAMHLANKMMLDIIFSDLAYAEKHPLTTDNPKKIIKSGYIQMVWEKNKIWT